MEYYVRQIILKQAMSVYYFDKAIIKFSVGKYIMYIKYLRI